MPESAITVRTTVKWGGGTHDNFLDYESVESVLSAVRDTLVNPPDGLDEISIQIDPETQP